MSLMAFKEVVAAAQRITVHQNNGEPFVVKSPRYGYQTLYFANPLGMYVACGDVLRVEALSSWNRTRRVQWAWIAKGDQRNSPLMGPSAWMPEVRQGTILSARWADAAHGKPPPVSLLDEASALCDVLAQRFGEGPVRIAGDPPLLFAGEPDWAYFGQ